MSTGFRNTVAIVVFVVVLLWAIASAQADGAVSERENRGRASEPVSRYLAVDNRASRSETARTAIRKVFGSKAPQALRVARCESHLNPRAVGSAGERGLFQIHPIHFRWAKPRRLFDPRWNALVAYRLSRGGTNWSHWTCRWAA